MIFQEGFIFKLLSCRAVQYAVGLPREILKQVQDDKLFFVSISTPENGHYQKYFYRLPHFLDLFYITRSSANSFSNCSDDVKWMVLMPALSAASTLR